MTDIALDPRVRSFIVGVLALVLSWFVGSEIGAGEYILPVGLMVMVIVVSIAAMLTRTIRLEALILGLLLFGYIVGQLGFAHASPLRRGGIFFGEIGMALCVTTFAMRAAIMRQRFVPRDPLAWLVLAFVGVGTLRFAFDFYSSHDRLTVLHDFATVYYAVFFFLAADIARDTRSRRFIAKVLTIALITVFGMYTIYSINPRLFFHVMIAGYPLVYPRSDLTGSFMGFACVLFYFKRLDSNRPGVWLALSIAAFAVIILSLSRATFVGFAVIAVLLVVARRPGLLGYLGAAACCAWLVFAVIAASRTHTGEETFITRVTDKALSIVDFSGKENYSSTTGEASAGNNRFRQSWWKAVRDETLEKNPIFGLGFGYNLTARFIRTYDEPLDEDFMGRSPHSILYTVLGRMGLVGLFTFAALVCAILWRAFKSAVRSRTDFRRLDELAYWCGIVTILITSCFGVMLEGPMAAIVFWSLLGIVVQRELLRRDSAVTSRQERAKSIGEVELMPA